MHLQVMIIQLIIKALKYELEKIMQMEAGHNG